MPFAVVVAVVLCASCSAAAPTPNSEPGDATSAPTPGPDSAPRTLAFSSTIPLDPGRYTRDGFEPRLSFTVGEDWYAVQAVTGFFDVERDPGLPDVVAVQFALPTVWATAEEAITALEGREALVVGEPQPVVLGGREGTRVVVDSADPDIAAQHFVEVLRVPAGPISIASGRRLQITFIDTSRGLLAVLVGGSVRGWDDAVAAAEPVLTSIEFGSA
jgi:hypothetical protein